MFVQCYDEFTSVLRFSGIVSKMEWCENVHFQYGKKKLLLPTCRYFCIHLIILLAISM